MNQITLRQIPENTYKQLRSIAKKNKTSINKTILNLLKKSLGIEENSDKKRNLSDLAGTWNKRRLDEFNKNTQVFEQIDNEVWK